MSRFFNLAELYRKYSARKQYNNPRVRVSGACHTSRNTVVCRSDVGLDGWNYFEAGTDLRGADTAAARTKRQAGYQQLAGGVPGSCTQRISYLPSPLATTPID